MIHRLDQPVEGVVVFGKTPAAAKALSAQMAQGLMGKIYMAVTFGKPQTAEGTLEDCLKKDGRTNTSSVVPKGTRDGKNAKLHYRLLQSAADESTGREKYLLRIQLETGRHHQIRVQMAHAGMGLIGDRKYNGEECVNQPLGLCSCSLEFVHPKTKKKMKFETTPKGGAFAGFECACII